MVEAAGERPLVPLVFVRASASVELRVREDFAVVWYMEERSSREARVAEVEGLDVPFNVVDVGAPGCVGRVPGCKDVRPRGVSRMTRKWPVKGGANAAGRDSGSIYIKE